MTLQDLEGTILYPQPIAANNILFTDGSKLDLDAADDRGACVFQVPKDGNIDAIGFRTEIVTTAPGADMDVRLETVDPATGEPTGTLADTNTNGAQTVTDVNNTWYLTALTASYAATMGEYLAVVIVNPSNPDHGDVQITTMPLDQNARIPYVIHETGGTWTKHFHCPMFAIRYDDASYPHIHRVWPYENDAQDIYGSDDAPTYRGNRFQLPFPAKVTGVWYQIDTDGAFEIILYDSDGSTPLGTFAVSNLIRNLTTAALNYFTFSSTITLAKDVDYRIIARPTTTTDIRMDRMIMNAAAQVGAISGGTKWIKTTATTPGSWTDVDTERFMIGLQISALPDDAGGGGGSRNVIIGG